MHKNNFSGAANGCRCLLSILGLVTVLLLAGCADSGLGGLAGKKHVPLPDSDRNVPPRTESRSPARPDGKITPAVTRTTSTRYAPAVSAPEPEIEPKLRQKALAFVRERSQAYQAEMAKWRSRNFAGEMPPEGWDECLQALERIAGRYGELRRKIIRSRLNVDEYTSLLADDVLFQASPCNTLGRQINQGMGPAACRELETALRDNSGQGNYQEVISLYKRLASVVAGEIAPEIKELYADALLKTGTPAAAAKVYGELAEKYAGFSPWPMKQQAARLYLAAGRVAEAENEYNELLAYSAGLREKETTIREQLAFIENAAQHRQELSWFSAVLRGVLSFDGCRLTREMSGAMAALESNFPETVYTRKARELYEPCAEQARAWLDRELARAENFLAEKKFAEAREALAALSSGAMPDELAARLQELDEQIRLAEAEEQETQQQLVEHARQVQWQEGVKLLDSRRYDDAIAVFTALLDSEYGPEAEKRIAEAQKQAAGELRRRSAGLFIKARKTADPQRKGELLLESRQMLLLILEKYPQVDIAGKVKQNLQVIENDIFQLDPALLSGDKEKKNSEFRPKNFE